MSDVVTPPSHFDPHAASRSPACYCCDPQGHFQIMFSTKYCPLFRSKLPFMSRLLYCSGVWSYCVNAVLTPIFMVRCGIRNAY